MVFPLAGADAHDHYHFTERDRLDRSPAVRAASFAALDAAGIGLDDVARFDLYSCFPSAVQITMGSLGLVGPAGGDARPLTVTGGLGFAGGPANNYPTHAIARMVEELRADPGSIGLVHAIGWYATKHSVGLYSTTPSAASRLSTPEPSKPRSTRCPGATRPGPTPAARPSRPPRSRSIAMGAARTRSLRCSHPMGGACSARPARPT